MRAHKQIISRLLALSLVFLFLLDAVVAAEEHLLPLQGTAKINNAVLTAGDIIIEMYDAASGGNLVYNSTNDFLNTISGGKYDVLIGNGSQPLSLKFGTKYYMDVYLNGADMDFNGSERQVFMSTVGNISVTTPIATSNNDTDDALNVSSGGSFFGGNVSINKTINITAATGEIMTEGRITATRLISTSNDIDDAVNITSGALSVGNTTSGGIIISSTRNRAFIVNDGFNISGANGSLITNGSISIQNQNLNPAFTINNGFNISGANSALVTNGTVSIQRPGAVVFSVNNAFNITGDPGGDILSNGTARFDNSDADDTINLTEGGLRARGMISVQNYTAAGPAFTVNMGFNISGADESLRTNGTARFENTDVDDALNVTAGFTAAGSAASNAAFRVDSAGKVVIRNTDVDDAFNVTEGGASFTGRITSFNTATDDALNISGGSRFGGTVYADRVTIDNNGQMIIRSGDADDALNVTAGFTAAGSAASDGAFRVDNTGAVKVRNPDADDALNVTAGFTAAGLAVSDGAFRVSSSGITRVQNNDVDDALNVTFGFTAGGNAINDGAFRVASTGRVRVQNNDADDAFNVSIGGSAFVGKVFMISNDADDAVNLTAGGLVARGQISVQNYTSATIPAFTVNFGFNISGADESLRTNGTISMITTNDLDALNVTGGLILGVGNPGAQFGIGPLTISDTGIITTQTNIAANGNIVIRSLAAQALSINSGFNVSGPTLAMTTNGTVTVMSNNNTAFNVSNDLAGSFFGGNITVGTDDSASFHSLKIFDGGADKCSLLVLFDEAGADYFIYVNGTNGFLTIANSTPTTCDEGQVVGRQN